MLGHQSRAAHKAITVCTRPRPSRHHQGSVAHAAIRAARAPPLEPAMQTFEPVARGRPSDGAGACALAA